jgi:arylsulfatase A-like enzyme
MPRATSANGTTASSASGRVSSGWRASWGRGKHVGCEFFVNGVREVPNTWVDDSNAAYAVRFMREHRQQPFVLFVGFKSPRRAWLPPKTFAKRWEGASLRPVPNLETRPPWMTEDAVVRSATDDSDNLAKTSAPAPARERIENELDHFRCLGAMDASVGTILKGIDELGLRDNTLVIFTSDNGHYKGEHRQGDKRSAYEESIRVPLLARWPGRIPAGSTPTQQLLSVDIPATVCAVAGVTPPVAMHGRDASGVLMGRSPGDWRKSWLYTYWSDVEFPDTPTRVALRTETHKLIVYRDQPGWTELFDLRSDPYEISNLANDAAHSELRAQLEIQLAAEKQAVQFRDPAGWPKKGKPRGKTH